jgi:hypothetical protein
MQSGQYTFADIAYSGYDVDIKINDIKLNSATTLYYMFDSVGESVKNDFKLEINNLEARSATAAEEVFLYGGQTTQSTIIKLKNWDTPSLTSTSGMFDHVGQGAKKYLEIVIDNVNVSNVTTMYGMFYSVGESNNGTVKLKFVNFDTSNVTNMSYMFKYFSNSAKEVYIDGIKDFNYSKVTNFDSWICYAIRNNRTVVDLGTIDLVNPPYLRYTMNEFKAVKAVINLRAVPTSYSSYSFHDVANVEGSEIKLNYTAETESVVDDIIASKEPNDNIVKGVLLED